MKITVEVMPESEAQKVIYVLMKRASFKEIDRVVTGGHMSAVMLAITFEGNEESFNLLSNLIYIEMPYSSTSKTYYSLKCLNGKICKSVDDFLDYIEKQIMAKPEIKYFNQPVQQQALADKVKEGK